MCSEWEGWHNDGAIVLNTQSWVVEGVGISVRSLTRVKIVMFVGARCKHVRI